MESRFEVRLFGIESVEGVFDFFDAMLYVMLLIVALNVDSSVDPFAVFALQSSVLAFIFDVMFQCFNI